MQPTAETSAAAVPLSDTPDVASRGTSVGSMLLKLISHHSILLMCVALFILFSILAPDTFPTSTNLAGLALGQSVAALLALAVLLVVVVGEFDLSVGYTLGLSAVLTAKLASTTDLPIVMVFVISMVAGAAVGALAGVLVTRFKVVSLIATLGIGLAVSGVTVGVSGGMTLSQGIPDTFTNLVRTEILGLGSAVWIVLGVALVMYLVLNRTPVGAKLYAVGGAEQVARMVGIRVALLKCLMFAVAGALAAFAGIMQLGFAGAANPAFGANLLLPAFAAVFLGSTTVRPGFFNVTGTMLAIGLLAIGFSGLSLLGAPFWVLPVFQGLALIVGVVLGQVVRARTKAGR